MTTNRTQPSSAIVLLSGGLDSPVAAFLAVKSGLDVTLASFVTNANDPNGLYQRKIIALGNKIATLADKPLELFMIPYFTVQDLLIERLPRSKTCVFCKRMMYRVVDRLAARVGADFLVTGDILGEQASQTLDNLYVISHKTHTRKILRPLIGLNKNEVISLAREIGTYELSIQRAPECEKNPRRPSTHATVPEVLDAEEKIDLQVIVVETLAGAVKYTLFPQ